jgi:hypothetical protein
MIDYQQLMPGRVAEVRSAVARLPRDRRHRRDAGAGRTFANTFVALKNRRTSPGSAAAGGEEVRRHGQRHRALAGRLREQRLLDRTLRATTAATA